MSTTSSCRAPDAILVVCGDHFGLIVDRPPELVEGGGGGCVAGGGSGGLVGIVDNAIARGDRRRAVQFLSLEASHGRVSRQEGKYYVTGYAYLDCRLLLNV